MNRELIIHSDNEEVNIALLEDKKLTELFKEQHGKKFSVGEIHLGRVKKLMPGLNAAFVDIGYEKEGFLHYTDLSPNIRSLMDVTEKAMEGELTDVLLQNYTPKEAIVKTGNITEVLKRGQLLLVQIVKEPISQKGPRLSCEISLADRHLVLSPFTFSVGVSRRIENAEERKRLKVLVESLKPKTFGAVVRTVAESKGAAELHQEVNNMVKRWKEIVAHLKGAKNPCLILGEQNASKVVLRDLLNDSFSRIVTDDALMKRELESYIYTIAPGFKGTISWHGDKLPIFDHYGITKQIKQSFGRNVTMSSGAYIIIEHTEAMHVIDVNSGYKAGMGGDQENNALRVNMEAAQEVCRQLRLRDMGGIIIIDFIDMRHPDNKKTLQNRMRELMENDKSSHTILPLSKFNLMQLTRERIRPQIDIATNEKCPACKGTGKVESTLLIIEDIERSLKIVIESHKNFNLFVHPFIEAYIKKGLRSIQWKWFWEYKKRIKIYPDSNLPITEFRFFDSNGKEIED